MRTSNVIKNILLSIFVITAAATTDAKNGKNRVPVIIETDMGNDIDDALAVRLAYDAVADGEIDLLMISNHKHSTTAPEFIDILNVWFGHPETIVANSSTAVTNNEYHDYTYDVATRKDKDGSLFYARSENNAGGYEDPVSAYRKLLSCSRNKSVVIISLGFGTTLEQLLDSKPDKYSRLDGKELIARKVKYLSLMAGSYGIQDTIIVNGVRETLFDKTKKRCEFNVDNDVDAMRNVIDNWPTRIYQIPFEIGKMVMYPGKIAESAKGPVFDAYRAYKSMPYDRPSWDILAVAYVLEPHMFSKSVPGTISIDSKGFTNFKAIKNIPSNRKAIRNAHFVLTLSSGQAENLLDYIVEHTSEPIHPHS